VLDVVDLHRHLDAAFPLVVVASIVLIGVDAGDLGADVRRIPCGPPP